nr:uncharacterized protein LOC107842511 isoform X1 [Ipomoea trifida]
MAVVWISSPSDSSAGVSAGQNHRSSSTSQTQTATAFNNVAAADRHCIHSVGIFARENIAESIFIEFRRERGENSVKVSQVLFGCHLLRYASSSSDIQPPFSLSLSSSDLSHLILKKQSLSSSEVKIQTSMATPEVLQGEDLIFSALFDNPKGENVKSRGFAIEKKIELLENLAGKVSNRRSRRWLNDRLLMELVPRLNAEEIRGLFAPPPFGDDVPLSPFCMTNLGEWDKFRNIDMDKEATMMKALESSVSKRKSCTNNDKAAVLTAWHRVDCRTREALRRNFLPELINNYEECLQTFIKESGDGDVLDLSVQDPFHRLLLHGVCEYYNLISVTVVTQTKGTGTGAVKITKIKKKKADYSELPNITLCNFLKMAKEGIWNEFLVAISGTLSPVNKAHLAKALAIKEALSWLKEKQWNKLEQHIPTLIFVLGRISSELYSFFD